MRKSLRESVVDKVKRPLNHGAISWVIPREQYADFPPAPPPQNFLVSKDA